VKDRQMSYNARASVGPPAEATKEKLADEAGTPKAQSKRRRTRMGGWIGGAILLLITLLAIFAPIVAPFDPNAIDLSMARRPPTWDVTSWQYTLGTDGVGRDVLSRTLYGARISILIGALAVIGSGLMGVTVGLLAGHHRGTIDRLTSWVIDVEMSVPFLAFAMLLVGIIGPGLNNTILALILSAWILYARVIRAETMTLTQRDWVLAAKALGASDVRIMFRHILPNLMPSVITIASFEFARLILMEASLSFLGLGVQPPTATWGNMISDARDYLEVAPWVLIAPGAALTLVVLSANLLGDYLRDAFSSD
jgi:peptide/nickel transport system permease protein